MCKRFKEKSFIDIELNKLYLKIRIFRSYIVQKQVQDGSHFASSVFIGSHAFSNFRHNLWLNLKKEFEKNVKIDRKTLLTLLLL